MKRFLAVLLCMFLLIPCFGCGEDSTDGSAKSKKFETGSISNERYKNEYFNINFKLPDGWRFYSRSEIKEVSGMANEIIDNVEFDFEANSNVIDMMASDSYSTNNVNIAYEKAAVSLNKYIEALKSNFAVMSSDDYVIDVTDETDYKLAGEKYKLLTVDTSLAGVSMKQYVFLRKEGGVICLITFTVLNDSYSVDELASFFK